MTDKLSPFDPSNPREAVADMFRRQISEIFLEASGLPVFQQLAWHEQMEAFVGGAMTAVVGICFAHVKPEGRDEIIKMIRAYAKQARANAPLPSDNG